MSKVSYNARDFAPISLVAAVPKDIVAKLHAEIVKALRRSDVREQLASQGASAIGNRPDEFAAYIKSETEKWGKVLKASGVTAP